MDLVSPVVGQELEPVLEELVVLLVWYDRGLVGVEVRMVEVVFLC